MNFSDDFAGLGAGSSVNTRSLNHALGGSGSYTWASASAVGATGGGAVAMAASYVRVTDNTNGVIRIKFQFSAGTNLLIAAFSTNTATAYSTFGVLKVNSDNTIRIRQFDSSGGSLGDVASAACTVSTGTDYYLEAAYNGTTVVGKVFASDGTTQVGSTASYTPGTYPSGGNLVISEYFGGGTATVDDFTHDSAPPPPPPPSGPFPFKRKSVEGGGMQSLGGLIIR